MANAVPIGTGQQLSTSGGGVVISGLDQVMNNLDAYARDFAGATHAAANEIAKVLANYAKSHHAWTPRSGNTDSSTDAQIVEETREYVMIALFAGMDYDVFLELARDGRWAWLEPAVIACKDKIIDIWVRRLKR